MRGIAPKHRAASGLAPSRKTAPSSNRDDRGSQERRGGRARDDPRDLGDRVALPERDSSAPATDLEVRKASAGRADLVAREDHRASEAREGCPR